MTEEGYQNFKQQLGELRAFMATGAYRSFLATTQRDAESARNSIVATVPTSQESLASVLLLQGELAAHISYSTFFEDACGRLEKDIEEQESSVFNKSHENENNEV